jgi:hypothetical protein
LSFQLTDHSRRILWEQFKLIVLPLAFSILIIFAFVSSVHFYRAAYAPGVHFSPRTPKAQRPFSFNVAKSSLPASDGSTLLLKIVKERDSFGSTRYWHSGKTVLSLPLQVSSCGICVRVALWDPGVYAVTLSDSMGHQVFSSPLSVIAPLALYRDDMILVLLTIILSWGSGKLSASVLGRTKPLDSTRLQRSVRLGCFAAGLMALALIFMPYPDLRSPEGMESSSMSMNSSSDSGAVISTLESEGRQDATPLPLLPAGKMISHGYLLIRHHMDSWTEFGRTLTIFEGPIGTLEAKNSFFLPPDDGRYFLSLWSADPSRQSLVNTRWVLRAIPVSPPFPAALLSGLTIFSLSGFIWGLLLSQSSYKNPKR